MKIQATSPNTLTPWASFRARSPRAAHRITASLWALAYAVAAAVVLFIFLQDCGINRNRNARLRDMVRGRAHKPSPPHSSTHHDGCLLFFKTDCLSEIVTVIAPG